MNAAQRQLLRTGLLQQLAIFAPGTLPLANLHRGAIIAGFTGLTETETAAELAYLVDKGLADTPTQLVSPELKRWRITATGRDYLAEQGIA